MRLLYGAVKKLKKNLKNSIKTIMLNSNSDCPKHLVFLVLLFFCLIVCLFHNQSLLSRFTHIIIRKNIHT